MSDNPRLTPFEGREVITARVAVTNAGDGLSAAMAVEPRELHCGDRVYLVIECDVTKVRFETVKDTDSMARVHILRAGAATLVDRDLVAAQLAEQQRRLEEARGVQQLPLDNLPEEGTLAAELDAIADPEPVGKRRRSRKGSNDAEANG